MPNINSLRRPISTGPSQGNPGGSGSGSVAVTISGSAGVGKVLTASPPAGWSASGWQWYRNGVAISGATSQTYTQQDADIGATLTVGGTGWSLVSQSGVSVPEPPFPVPTNNRIAIYGDSRTANSTELANSALADRGTAQGWGSWMQVFSDARGQWTGNYGINTDTIDGLITRLTAAGISGGTDPGDPRRGFLLQYDPGLSAGIIVLLIGVNNTTEPITTTGPKYDQLLMALIDAGKVVVLCNELPNSDQSGQGAVNYGRRQYLDAWPDSSTGMTALQKTTYRRKVVKCNTYDALAQSPTSYQPKAGYYQDLLHPAAVGSRYLGETIGTTVAAMLEYAGYAPRNTLPTSDSQFVLPNGMLTGSVAITATNGESAGAGGANMDGNGQPCVTGVLPTGYAIGRGSSLRTLLNAAQPVSGSQLSVVCSKTVDSDGFDAVRIRITGQVGTTGSIYGVGLSRTSFFTSATIGATNGSVGVADGDALYTIGRVKLADGHRGLVGAGLLVQASSTTYPNVGNVLLTGSISNSALRWDGMASGFDKAILSQPRVIPAGFAAAAETKTLMTNLDIHIAGGVPIDIDITVSRLGMVKNR